MSLFDHIRRSILGNGDQSAAKPVEPVAITKPVAEEPQGERRRRKRVNARHGTHVLIIDDSPTIVAALKKLLTSAKYITYEAFDAESGLKIAQERQPDLIFLDIVLPGMNGFAALRLMRKDPKTQHIPIIMISGNEQATEQFYANRIGADDFMKKPFSRFEVFARIEPLLDSGGIPRRKGSIGENTTGDKNNLQLAQANDPVPAPAVPLAKPALSGSILPTTHPVATASFSFPQQTSENPPTQASPSYGTPPAATVQLTAPSFSTPPVITPSPTHASPLDARKELTAMGLPYFDQGQFVAAIKRGDKLACELFIAGGGIDLAAETDGKTPLQIARENGRTQIFALIRARLAATGV